MALSYDLEELGRHLKDRLNFHRTSIVVGTEPAFSTAVYGEPRVITQWPTASIQPVSKARSLREGATRKFRITLTYNLILYHGKLADTLSIQSETHKKAEAIDRWFGTDYKWNFVDSNVANNKVIWGQVTALDHPVVLAPEQELWSSSRLELVALSEEVF